jgi:hypothetical protein
MQLGQRWHGARSAQGQPFGRRDCRRVLLDGVQLRDAAQRFVSDRTAVGSMQVEEFAPDMGQASQFGRPVSKQGFVAGVVVYHQVATPVLKEVAGVLAGPASW